MGLAEKLSSWAGRRGKERRVLVLGLERSGKSAVVRAVRGPGAVGGEGEAAARVGGVALLLREAGGARRHRALWERDARACQALVFVVDAADRLRLAVAREELALLLAHPDVAPRRLPLLVLANKADLPDALPPERVAAGLSLERVSCRAWQVSGCSAASGAGLQPAVAWLAAQIRE